MCFVFALRGCARRHSAYAMNTVNAEKTILVFGSKKLDATVDVKRALAERIGEAIVSEPGWRLLTGGRKGSGPCAEMGGVDYHAALGAQKRLRDPAKERERIWTVHPQDRPEGLFEIGFVLASRAKSTPARRFELVSRCDCALAIEGHDGTAQIIEHCIAADKPVIPIACTGGESQQAWVPDRYRKELLRRLGVVEGSPELAMLENGLGTPKQLVDTCLQLVRQLLRPTCFAVMPLRLPHSEAIWNEVFRPAIERAGMTADRGDLVHNAGQIMEDVTRCISAATVVIADITATNPNVMYELGYAHALKTPTVLVLWSEDSDALDKVPFDIRGMRVMQINSRLKDKCVEELSGLLRRFAR